MQHKLTIVYCKILIVFPPHFTTYSYNAGCPMNEITQRLKSHRSTRSYSDKPVPEEVMDDVIEAAWRAPTSVNSQQVSLVVVRDVKPARALLNWRVARHGLPRPR